MTVSQDRFLLCRSLPFLWRTVFAQTPRGLSACSLDAGPVGPAGPTGPANFFGPLHRLGRGPPLHHLTLPSTISSSLPPFLYLYDADLSNVHSPPLM